MTLVEAAAEPTEFTHDDNTATRLPVRASMGDGAILRAYLYRRELSLADKRRKAPKLTTPLLCLPTELGNARQLHRIALALAFHEDTNNKIYTLSLRGRGDSDHQGAAASDLTTDADDLISFCDAHNLHHIDVMVSGYTVFTVFSAMSRRPSLVRRLILNDSAPEFDAVGIARRTALMQRTSQPENWEACAEQLRDLKGEEFPQFTDSDWLDMAKQDYRLEESGPVPDIAKGLVRWSNMADYDAQQPSLWPELRLFNRNPVLLVHGEHSGLVTTEIAQKTQAAHPDMDVIEAIGQGHVPQLERGPLPGQIVKFLLRAPNPAD